VPEDKMPGGFVNEVVRDGDTVRRFQSPNAAFVHALLDLFAQHNWTGAPRFLGLDSAGKEVLSFVSGYAAWEPVQPADVSCDESLAAVAVLVRQFHDLTAGTILAGTQQVVCHNDLSPKNTIYRDFGHGLRPIAFVDWDLAASGLRIHDVAHMCWQYVNLGPSIPDPSEAIPALRVLCDAYGLVARADLVRTILWWQDRCWRGIESGAASGDPACRALREAGKVEEVRASSAWVRRHYHVLDQGIR
jgi:Phosphotransferase enzyme family